MRITTLMAVLTSFVLFAAPMACADEAAEEGSQAAAEEATPPQDTQLYRALEVLKSWDYFDRLRGGVRSVALETPPSS